MSALSDYFYKGPTFTLKNGRTINIQRLQQTLTYSYILEGIPYGPNYQQTVNLHLKWARDRYPNSKVIALEPRLRPLAIPPKELEERKSLWLRAKELNERHQSGERQNLDTITDSSWPEPVCIGSVCCTAMFESSPISGKEEGMLSELIVIWFQDGFALPIDPLVAKQIEAIDWDNEAINVDL